jgi:AraC-like DNA-binding protein
MPPDRSHGYQVAEGVKLWQYRWIEFSGEMTPGLLKMFGLDGLPCVHDCREAWPAVEEVVHALETGGNSALHEAASLFLRVLAIVERRMRPERGRLPVVSQLDLAVKRFVADHLEEEISLPDVARAVRSSPHHLIRVFKRNNGKTPMAYLRQLRAERAKGLLMRGDLSVKEVGQRVGYPVVQHFSRMFRLETGLSPRAYLRTQLGRT